MSLIIRLLASLAMANFAVEWRCALQSAKERKKNVNEVGQYFKSDTF